MGNLLFSDSISNNVPDYIVSIKSGDKNGAGITTGMSIAFYKVDGERSEDFEYDCEWRHGFEPGSVKNFPIYKMS